MGKKITCLSNVTLLRNKTDVLPTNISTCQQQLQNLSSIVKSYEQENASRQYDLNVCLGEKKNCASNVTLLTNITDGLSTNISICQQQVQNLSSVVKSSKENTAKNLYDLNVCFGEKATCLSNVTLLINTTDQLAANTSTCQQQLQNLSSIVKSYEQENASIQYDLNVCMEKKIKCLSNVILIGNKTDGLSTNISICQQQVQNLSSELESAISNLNSTLYSLGKCNETLVKVSKDLKNSNETLAIIYDIIVKGNVSEKAKYEELYFNCKREKKNISEELFVLKRIKTNQEHQILVLTKSLSDEKVNGVLCKEKIISFLNKTGSPLDSVLYKTNHVPISILGNQTMGLSNSNLSSPQL